MTIEIKCCARCQEDHPVDFEKLDNHATYSFWGMCPNKKQPVFLIVSDDDEG